MSVRRRRGIHTLIGTNAHLCIPRCAPAGPAFEQHGERKAEPYDANHRLPPPLPELGDCDLHLAAVQMAMVVLATLPILVVFYPFLQKYFAKGVITGAIRG